MILNIRYATRRALCACMVLIIALALCLTVPRRALAQPASPFSEGRNQYHFTIAVSPQMGGAQVQQQVSYTNRTGGALDAVFFQVYPNAFRRQITTPFEAGDMDVAYPEGFMPGGIEMTSVMVDGKTADYGFSGEAESVLRVAAELPPGARAEITMEFWVSLPRTAAQYGRSDFDMRFCNFFPIAAIYEAGEWKCYPYTPIGEPFYSEVADYTAEIVAPDSWQLACTGDEQAVETRDKRTTWQVSAPAVRDFALVLTRGLSTFEREIGGVRVTVYARDKRAGESALEDAASAIAQFGEWYGPYPYADFDVLESDFFIGGMEYPGLVLIGQNFMKQREQLRALVVHETAHQWWYGLVGSDSREEPWLDEALAHYATAQYIRAQQGEEAYERFVDEEMRPAMHITIPGGVTVDSPTWQFNSSSDYFQVIYMRGGMVMYYLDDAMGEGALLRAMKRYATENVYGIVKRADFERALKEESGSEWSKFLTERFTTIGRE